jgi:hypothetical protein
VPPAERRVPMKAERGRGLPDRHAAAYALAEQVPPVALLQVGAGRACVRIERPAARGAAVPAHAAEAAPADGAGVAAARAARIPVPWRCWWDARAHGTRIARGAGDWNGGNGRRHGVSGRPRRGRSDERPARVDGRSHIALSAGSVGGGGGHLGSVQTHTIRRQRDMGAQPPRIRLAVRAGLPLHRLASRRRLLQCPASSSLTPRAPETTETHG